MITSPAFAGKRYAVLGLARSGAATVEALLASGASVMAWDSNEDARSKILPQRGRGTARSVVEGYQRSSEGEASAKNPQTLSPLHQPAAGPPPPMGEDRLRIADPLVESLDGFDAVAVSPGIPLNTHPIASRAREANVPVIGDVELFAQARASLPPHKVVGITGTNGKSTTTALIHHILKTAGVPTTMGGNIGLPILAQDPLPEGGVYVLELSSYQIDLTQSLDCDVAVLLNVTPDHLDRYESFEAYADSKARLFARQSQDHLAIVVAEDDQTRRILASLGVPANAGTQTGLSPPREHKVVRVMSARVPDQIGSAQSDWPALQGPHNLQNVAASVAVCQALGLSAEAIEQGLRAYPGLPHRMERAAERNEVLFVNDSKATNADSTAPALAAYPHIHWILGGRAKTEELGPCEQHLGHVRAAYTIGEAGPMFARLLAGKVKVTESGTLDQAVRDAAQAARPGEVVLLSPACASFDQFRDYEARGDAFRAAVEALP